MDERGFTLIELLVVVLIMGILAAIALPAFLGYRERALDTNAKQDVRNAVSEMEACYRGDEEYTGCPDAEHPLARDVAVDVAPDGRSYTLSQESETGTIFVIDHVGITFVHSCSAPGVGGCRDGGAAGGIWWPIDHSSSALPVTSPRTGQKPIGCAMHLPRIARARRVARDEGSVLIEVVVTAALLVIVALGVLKALDAADARGAGQKGKAVAGNIAQAEQERLRSLSVDQLSSLGGPTTVPQGNVNYSVDSRAEWVTDATGEASCASEGAPDFLKLTTTVSSPALRGRKPVTLSSILAPPARAFKANEGSLIVQISDRNGDGVPGLSLTLTGPKNVSGITNAQGCVLWGALPAASTYTLRYSRGGWVDPFGAESITKTSVGVTAEQVHTDEYLYDEGGILRASFVTHPPSAAAGVLKPSAPEEATIEHPGPPSTLRGFPMTGNSIDTPLLFPFTSDYAIYAGCPSSRPSAPTFKTVLPGGVTDAGAIEIPAIDFKVTNNGNNVNNASVHVKTPCGKEYDRNTKSNGRLEDPGYPYGTGFEICVHTANNNRERRFTAVSNVASQNFPVDLTGMPGGSCS